MSMKKVINLICLLSVVYAKANINTDLPKTISVFVDCEFCDLDFIKTELNFVNYSRETKEADVHILLINQNTASGGELVTVFFIGQKSFKNSNDTLTVTFQTDDTHYTKRERLVKLLKLGLIKYVNKMQVSENISISYLKNEDTAVEKSDKWNMWVFEISASGWGDGDKNRSSFSVNSEIEAEKITEKFKTEFEISNNYSESSFNYQGFNYYSYNRSYHAYNTTVFSINKNWSAGIFTNFWSSTYSNMKFQASLRPAVEFNVFPYSEATRRQLRIHYSVGPQQNFYFKETIYDKTQQFLWRQNIGMSAEIIQKWGRLSTNVSFNNFMHDFSLNRVNFHNSVNVRVMRGLEFFTSFGFNFIHDQLSIAKMEATPEEILLQRKELKTNYSYWANVGISFTFGNLYNNVVNPRFGN